MEAASVAGVSPCRGRRARCRPESRMNRGCAGRALGRATACRRGRRVHAEVLVVGSAELGLALAVSNPQAEVHIFEPCWEAVDGARAVAQARGLSRVHVRHASALRMVCRSLR